MEKIQTCSKHVQPIHILKKRFSTSILQVSEDFDLRPGARALIVAEVVLEEDHLGSLGDAHAEVEGHGAKNPGTPVVHQPSSWWILVDFMRSEILVGCEWSEWDTTIS